MEYENDQRGYDGSSLKPHSLQQSLISVQTSPVAMNVRGIAVAPLDKTVATTTILAPVVPLLTVAIAGKCLVIMIYEYLADRT